MFARFATGLAMFIGWCMPLAAQNFERYRPQDLTKPNPFQPPVENEIPRNEAAESNHDDSILVQRLDAIVIVDAAEKVCKEARIDDLEGIHYDFAADRSVVYCESAKEICRRYLGQPITLRRVNQLAADLIKYYQRCKYPVVDVQIPEQRITGGTLHFVVIESRVGEVKIEPGCTFSEGELERWISCTQPGDRIYEPNLESDLMWLNQNPFRRVKLDFAKGVDPGTTDVIFKSSDVRPWRVYTGADDTGVDALNYGRLFTGFSHGNVLGRGGTLGYQYTTDQEWNRLHAHALTYSHPIDRVWSFQTLGSWAAVSPAVLNGIQQTGTSWQVGLGVQRNTVRTQREIAYFSAGADFKSTDNNLEFSGTTLASSKADLLQLRLGYYHLLRLEDVDEYAWLDSGLFIGPGDGFTRDNTTAAFNTIRPGTSPSYVYGTLRLEASRLVPCDWQLVNRFTAQAASRRLLFSEMLGIGGFDTLRGFDQRIYNADHGWIANFELGPRTKRWTKSEESRVRRDYAFIDLANGYIESGRTGELDYQFAMSTGVGTRFQISDRLIARADWGIGVVDLKGVERDNRLHFSVTWIPGPRPK